MNNFKKYNDNIKFKIYLDNDRNTNEGLQFCANSTKDIWVCNNKDDFGNFCFKKELCRSDWIKIRGYSEDETSKVAEDFKKALQEFSEVGSWEDYKEPANLYFIGLIRNALGER